MRIHVWSKHTPDYNKRLASMAMWIKGLGPKLYKDLKLV